MKYNQLNVSASKAARRVGRGISAGQGKTAGRGTKGQKSRTGSSRRPGFEGGQNPLLQRLPKLRGFKSLRAKAETINIRKLERLTGSVDNQVLAEAGLISSPYVRVKVIGNQEVSKKLNVRLQAASAEAIKLIEKAGGSFTVVPQVGRPLAKKTDKTEKTA